MRVCLIFFSIFSAAQYLIEGILSRMNQERRCDYTMCFRYMFFFFAIQFFIFPLFFFEKDSIANKRDLNLSMMILVFLHWPRQFYFNQRFCMAQSAVISNVIWTSILIKKKKSWKSAEKTTTTSTNCIVRSFIGIARTFWANWSNVLQSQTSQITFDQVNVCLFHGN